MKVTIFHNIERWLFEEVESLKVEKLRLKSQRHTRVDRRKSLVDGAVTPRTI